MTPNEKHNNKVIARALRSKSLQYASKEEKIKAFKALNKTLKPERSLDFRANKKLIKRKVIS